MAAVEIDENELGNLKRVRDTVARISASSEGKRLLQKAHKLVDPNAVTPELDEDEAKSKSNSEWQKKFEELQGKIEADAERRNNDTALAMANSKWEAGRRSLRDAGYTSEGVDMVEKLMQEKGIGEHEIAAAWIEKQNPPQEVLSPRAFGAFNFVEPPKDNDDFMKALFASKGNDDNAVLKAATEAIAEVRQGRTNRR